jgi:hypothetical protein
MPGVIELLFLGSYLPTFKERCPDPEGPARDGGSRESKPPRSPPNGPSNPLQVGRESNRPCGPSSSKDGTGPRKRCTENGDSHEIAEIVPPESRKGASLEMIGANPRNSRKKTRFLAGVLKGSKEATLDLASSGSRLSFEHQAARALGPSWG